MFFSIYYLQTIHLLLTTETEATLPFVRSIVLQTVIKNVFNLVFKMIRYFGFIYIYPALDDLKIRIFSTFYLRKKHFSIGQLNVSFDEAKHYVPCDRLF